MLLWKCPNCRFFRLQIQYAPGCNQTVGIFLSMSLQLDTRAPSGDPRTPAGSLRGTGAAKPQGCSNSPSSPLWPTCEGPTLVPDLTPLPTSAVEPQGDNTAEGTPAWDQGTTGGRTESRGMHPKSYSCLFFTCSMEGSKPCKWDGYGAQRAEAIPLSWGPPARSPVKPRLLMQKGCQGMIWSLIYALHVAPKSCFHKINNFFFPPGETPLLNFRCSQHGTSRWEVTVVRTRLSPTPVFGNKDVPDQLWQRNQCIFSTMSRIPKTETEPAPRLPANSPRCGRSTGPGEKPNCHVVRYCENGNHFCFVQ